MARIQNRVVMGYFPTPRTVIKTVSEWLTLPAGDEQKWRLLDPCCGTGEAAQLADLVGGVCETWGVELSPKRAEEASRVMTKVINTGWRQTRADKESVSLLWLNPPYDHDLDGESKRLEIEFLRTSLSTLVDGGILVYIVPKHLLGYKAAALRLAGHFDDLVIRRFPDGEYERFKQLVVLGRKKPYKMPTGDEVDAIRALADATAVVAPLTAMETAPEEIDELMRRLGPNDPAELFSFEQLFVIPPAPENARFRRVSISRREQVARAYNAGWPDDLLRAMEYKRQVDFCPALPPKKGHIAMIMSSGVRGIMSLNKNGQQMLVKGRTVKERVSRTEEDEKGQKITITTYKPKSVVGIVSGDGVQVIDKVDGLTEFMKSYGDVLAEKILQDNQPLYNPLHPPAAAWEHLGTLGRNRRPLPGQAEAGMLDTQKHVAIAMARALQAHGSGLIQGEMGTGKTTISLGVIDLMEDAYPALVLCPPHLPPKWMREALEVIPGVQIRELRRIGKTASMDHEENDVREFVEDWEAGLLGDKAIAVVSSTSAKLGSGWEGAMAKRYALPRDEDDRGPFRSALKRYEKAREELNELQREGASENRLAGQRQVLRTLRRAALDEAIAYPVCPICGQIPMEGPADEQIPIRSFKTFDKKALSCNRPVQGWARDENGELVLDDEGNPIWVWEPETAENAPVCGTELYQFGGYRRYPIADYIFNHAKGFFQTLVVDEIHHYKGKSSDRGIAFARMVDAARYTLGLTGTIYGGKASDIYWLLWRLGIKDIQQIFSYPTARQWVEMYGVLEERQYGGGSNSSGDDDYGSFNATRRGRKVVSEKPGVSPGILRYMLDNTAFLALKDLGIGLPPYKEEMVTVEMTEAQGAQYRSMEGYLRGLAREDPRYLSTWLQRSLGRPSSGFRDEEVIKLHREDGKVIKHEHLYDLPAVDAGTLLPKESWLVSYAQAEVETGRKVLLYARQTGTYDIQPRLKRVLENAGLRVGVLTTSVGTRKREEWIDQHSHEFDVLITNPRLVETGLDLVQFATIVFYEISYSLFTIWQAMRRVWRLGQTKLVKVVFTAYANTLEESALALMGQKMGAAQLLYGDEVVGALVPEDTGDFLTQLARSVLEDKELPDLQALFAELQPTTGSPMGSPTARSPQLQFVDLRTMWKNNGGGRRYRRHKVVSEAQIALF